MIVVEQKFSTIYFIVKFTFLILSNNLSWIFSDHYIFSIIIFILYFSYSDFFKNDQYLLYHQNSIIMMICNKYGDD